jgi:hypothetical protein
MRLLCLLQLLHKFLPVTFTTVRKFKKIRKIEKFVTSHSISIFPILVVMMSLTSYLLLRVHSCVCTHRGSVTEPFVGCSAVHGPAWPESPGFGLARGGFGFVKPQARPKPPLTAWLRLGLAQARAFVCKNITCLRIRKKFSEIIVVFILIVVVTTYLSSLLLIVSTLKHVTCQC